MITEETARNIARAIGVSLFERAGYTAKACAQHNLTGKTHYCEDSTLRFFFSRINSARARCEGTVFLIVESVAADHQNTSRGFRFVAFDLFGTVLNDRPNAISDDLRRKSDKAEQDAADWLESFDVLAHYRHALAERAERLQSQAAEMISAAAKLES